jgi:hypothetical protein
MHADAVTYLLIAGRLVANCNVHAYTLSRARSNDRFEDACFE